MNFKPVVLTNAFSISMIEKTPYYRQFDGEDWTNYHLFSLAEAVLQFIPVTPRLIAEMITERGVNSYVGHPDTAKVISSILGVDVPFDAERRSFVFDDHGQPLFVAQYSGPRLPAGAESLPDGARIDFWMVVHDYHQD